MASHSPAELRWLQLDRLLDLLDARLPTGTVGIIERRRVEHVLLQAGLPHDGPELGAHMDANREEVRWLLAALLAQDKAQREAIDQVLDVWMAGLPRRPSRGRAEASWREVEGDVVDAENKHWRWGLLAFGLIGMVVWVLWGQGPNGETAATDGGTSTGEQTNIDGDAGTGDAKADENGTPAGGRDSRERDRSSATAQT